MRPYQIGIYPLYATRPAKAAKRKTNKSTQKKQAKIADSKRATHLFIDPADIVDSDGDMDSAERWFANKDRTGSASDEKFNQATFAQHIEDAQAIHMRYQLKSANSPYRAKVNQSFKNICLPEALLYYTVLNSTQVTEFAATLTLKQIPHLKPVLQLELAIRYGQNSTKWELRYHMMTRKVDIYQNGQKCGQVHYRIRGMKVEEIEGTLMGKPLVLDPVWHPKIKGELREERFKIGPHSMNLIYHLNESFSVGTPEKDTLKVAHKPHKRSLSKAVVRKHISLQHYSGPGQLLYMKGILIPICGEWHLRTSASH